MTVAVADSSRSSGTGRGPLLTDSCSTSRSGSLPGDVLVVAVNADSTVRGLKGPGRPILDEQARAQLVGSLRDVDFVLLFSEPNVEFLLEELHPDVHAKGTDYTAENVAERPVSDRLGIRVAIVGDTKNHSTRAFLDAVRKGPHG